MTGGTQWSRADQASSVLQVYAMEDRNGKLGDEGSDEFRAVVLGLLVDLKHLLFRADPGLLLTDLVEEAVEIWGNEAEALPEGGPDE